MVGAGGLQEARHEGDEEHEFAAGGDHDEGDEVDGDGDQDELGEDVDGLEDGPPCFLGGWSVLGRKSAGNCERWTDLVDAFAVLVDPRPGHFALQAGHEDGGHGPD